MYFRFPYHLFLCLILSFSNWSCSSNVEDCLEEGSCGPLINVANYDGSLPDNPFDPFWNGEQSPTAVKIDLGPQMITNPKWPNPSTQQVWIRAVKNGDEVVVMLEWNDDVRGHLNDPEVDRILRRVQQL